MASRQVHNALYKLEVVTGNIRLVRVSKLTASFELLETYHINIHPTFIICSCFAGAKDCRHQKMFRLWNEFDMWGKGFLYNFDKKIWIPPTNPE